MASEDGRNFDISSVISRTFSTIGANLPLFLGLSIILSGIPAFALNLWRGMQGLTETASPDRVLTTAYWMPILVVSVVSMITSAILQAALTRATVMSLSGETPSFGATLATGIANILPMIVISILLGLGLILGFILLIVPGIILWLMWSVVVPVYVQEKAGIFGSFGRSAELTSGAKGKIFLLMLILVVGVWLLSIPAGILVVVTRGMMTSPIGPAIVTALIGSLSSMVSVTIAASIYVELRDVKEGVAPDELESIFA